MKKIIWIDIGTHFAQEYRSIFGSNIYFYFQIIKRFLAGKLLNRGKYLNYQSLKDLILIRKKIRRRSEDFYTIFIEANPRISVKKNIYLGADMALNIALTGNTKKSVSIQKLFLINGSKESLSNTIFKNKLGVNEDIYTPTLGISASHFFSEIELFLNQQYGDYDVMLRVNCEGVEDDVIYAAHNSFGKRLKLVCGALKDVEAIKGINASKELENFLNKNSLPFALFYSGISTWLEGQAAVLNFIEKNKD
tara:strand:- start:10432 stop:11181 length:750 start_codon:yes stop_codon:yes gene_type:complete